MVLLKLVGTGEYWTTAESLTLQAQTDIQLLEKGYYYTFTTGAEKLWYFFALDNGSVTIYTESKTKLGNTAIQLEPETNYYLVATGSGQATMEVSTLVEYADGKTFDGAFTYNEETMNLPVSPNGNYEFYFKFTVEESGTYRFYTQASSLDSKGYLYETAGGSQIKYIDDDSSKATLTGHRYNFYFEYSLEAGKTYYLRVTYSISNSYSPATIKLMIEKLS